MLLTKVTPKLIQECVPYAYMPTKFENPVYSEDVTKQAITKVINSLKTNEPTSIRADLIGNYQRSVTEIKTDMINAYNPNIWQTLKGIDSNSNYISDLQKLKNLASEPGSSNSPCIAGLRM